MEEKLKPKNNQTFYDDVEDDVLRVVTLTFGDGTQSDCGILAEYPVGERDYIALFTLDSEKEPEDTELYIFRKNWDGDIVSFEDIVDDDEFSQAQDALYELMGDENMESEIVTLEFDDGSEMECEIFDIFSVGDKKYAALLPLDEEGEVFDDTEFLFFGVVEAEDGKVVELVDIVDDDEYDEVVDVFEADNSDEFGEDDDRYNRFTMEFDDGTHQDCKIVSIFPVGEKNYIALMPTDDDGNFTEDTTIGIYRFEEKDGHTAMIEFIDDDEEFAKAADTLGSLLHGSEDAG